MSDDLVLGPTTAIAGTGAAPAAAPGATAGSPEFRRLLDSLERLRRPAPTATPASGDASDADRLQHALHTADAEFAAAMDLRRRLEEAFRARLQ